VVIGIHINGIADKSRTTKPLGPNPFDNLALAISTDGRQATPMEWKDSRWQWYSDLESFIVFQKQQSDRGKTWHLSHWYPTYDWAADAGYQNFSAWIE
jgi:hypothetical protein